MVARVIAGVVWCARKSPNITRATISLEMLNQREAPSKPVVTRPQALIQHSSTAHQVHAAVPPKLSVFGLATGSVGGRREGGLTPLAEHTTTAGALKCQASSHPPAHSSIAQAISSWVGYRLGGEGGRGSCTTLVNTPQQSQPFNTTAWPCTRQQPGEPKCRAISHPPSSAQSMQVPHRGHWRG